MEQYIPKSVLAAEIERRIESCAKQREDMLNVQCYFLADFESARMGELNCIKDFLDTLEVEERQEEPVSEVWHDMSESVENGRNIIIIDPADFYGAVLRKGGSQLKNHNKERYVKWAYIDDLQNLSNVERTVKNWKEPVSEELEDAAWLYYDKNILPIPPELNLHREFIDFFKAGAKWQEAKDKQVLNEEGVVVLPEEAFERMKRSLIELAEKEQQMMANATEVTVHIDAGGYPYIPQMELYDYDKDVPLAKEGDKYKVVLIKED